MLEEFNDEEFPLEAYADIEKIRIARERVRIEDSKFFIAVSTAIFMRDPMTINLGFNTDEYDSEAGTVIPRLKDCSSVNDVTIVLHEEFINWFSDIIAGNRDQYIDLAKDIWNLYQQRRQT